jgi:hypothetical protein
LPIRIAESPVLLARAAPGNPEVLRTLSEAVLTDRPKIDTFVLGVRLAEWDEMFVLKPPDDDAYIDAKAVGERSSLSCRRYLLEFIFVSGEMSVRLANRSASSSRSAATCEPVASTKVCFRL